MKRTDVTALVATLAACLVAASAAAQSSPPRPVVVQDGVAWQVEYLIDTSQVSPPNNLTQFDSPRDNRGVGISPDGRYLYLGYNSPAAPEALDGQTFQVRRIDTTVSDFTSSIVAIRNGHRGKAITVDDMGRVYLAEGSDSDAHGGGIHIFDPTLGSELFIIPRGSSSLFGLSKPEGVAVTRESGVLALYVTDRTNRKLHRFVINEGVGFAIDSVTKTGLWTGTGEVEIANPADLRGIKIDPITKRIWMADLSNNRVFRCEPDGSGCLSTVVARPMDAAPVNDLVYVPQAFAPTTAPAENPPTITVLRASDMGFEKLLSIPWDGLQLDRNGQRSKGIYLGQFGTAATTRLPNGDVVLYLANERGQTANEKSIYGLCDAESDNPGGPCTYTDLYKDDNEPVFKLVTRSYSIGDFVWIDTDGDGIQDAGEVGIPGVTVTLVGPNSTQTTTTDADGKYLFTGLAPGSYTVTVATPSGYTPSPSSAAGSTPSNDSNGSPALVTLTNADDLTIDFGFVPPPSGSIGDFVWHDINGNGIQDAGEPGIDGVTVTLTGPGGTQTTTTGLNGYYQFTGLPAGSYTVTVSTPAGYDPTVSNAGGNPALDSNGSPASVVLPTNSSSDQTIDFGFVLKKAALGDFVWHDVNQNGIQDTGEAGIAGVTVRLLDSIGTVIATTTTNASGLYQFSNLTPGTYQVQFVLPAGYAFSPADVGANDAKDSDAKAGGFTQLVTLAPGETNLTLDAGMYVPCTGMIGDFVWHDLNANGRQDAGEPGIGGVTVQLKNSSNVVIATTTTAANGSYLFTGLCGGSYTVIAATPSGFVPTTSFAANTTTATDSNGSPASVTLPNQMAVDRTIDFGFVKVATGYSTFTQGGWGTDPSGRNPGWLLATNFSKVFPGGSVTIGGTKTLKFTSANAIRIFLPQGSTPGVLKTSATNPSGSAAGVFAGQVLALQLNVSFSNAGVTKTGLANLKIVSGNLAGYTVAQVLALANKVLGGDLAALPAGMSLSNLNDVVDAINNNYVDDGNNGYLY